MRLHAGATNKTLYLADCATKHVIVSIEFSLLVTERSANVQHVENSLGLLLLVFSCVASMFTLVAAFAFAAFMRRPTHVTTGDKPVTLLKPLHREEETVHDHLTSFVKQTYAGPSQIVCGLHSASDPALPAIGVLRARENVEVVIDSQMHGTNRKVSNLINIYPSTLHDILVITDSDILVSSDWLSAIVGALQMPGVGVASCLYRGRAGSGLWSQIAAMGISYQFLPSAAFGIYFDIVRPCFGSTHRNSSRRFREDRRISCFCGLPRRRLRNRAVRGGAGLRNRSCSDNRRACLHGASRFGPFSARASMESNNTNTSQSKSLRYGFHAADTARGLRSNGTRRAYSALSERFRSCANTFHFEMEH